MIIIRPTDTADLPPAMAVRGGGIGSTRAHGEDQDPGGSQRVGLHQKEQENGSRRNGYVIGQAGAKNEAPITRRTDHVGDSDAETGDEHQLDQRDGDE
jgi:hypothetical protein